MPKGGGRGGGVLVSPRALASQQQSFDWSRCACDRRNPDTHRIPLWRRLLGQFWWETHDNTAVRRDGGRTQWDRGRTRRTRDGSRQSRAASGGRICVEIFGVGGGHLDFSGKPVDSCFSIYIFFAPLRRSNLRKDINSNIDRKNKTTRLMRVCAP